MRKLTIVLCFLVCVLWILSCSGRGNQGNVSAVLSTGTGDANVVRGKVTDDRGAPLPGVSVVLESKRFGSLSATTAVDGEFHFGNLHNDEYTCTFSIEGFTEVRQEGIRFSGGQISQLSITLRPSMAEEFAVIGEAPLIDMRRTGNTHTYRPEDNRGGRSSGSKSSSGKAAASSRAQADELVVVVEGDPSHAPDSQERFCGVLQAQNSKGKMIGEFVLQRTEVEAQITGYLASTTIRQDYSNPFQEVIEGVYQFPLPTLSAVHDFEMEIGDRRIVGIVRPRQEAERIYSEAKERGQTASLLTQERPNIFTQHVANIESGGVVAIRITYYERLSYEGGNYEYVMPMTIGPRYNPDGSQITPPSSKRGNPSPKTMKGHSIGVTVLLDAGMPIQDIRSVAHRVKIEVDGPARRIIRLAEEESIANRDFVLRWSVAGKETQAALFTHRSEGDGFFTLMLQPPLEPGHELVAPREITLIMDVSGSMSGLPLETSRDVVRNVLDHMRPQDLFNIVFFSGSNGQLWERPQPANAENINAAREFLKELQGNGGTEMLAGLGRALGAEHDPAYLQMYVFLTDGFVGNEAEILRTIKEERNDARFFAFGIGSSVNRYLIDGIGEIGGGVSRAVLPRDEAHARKAALRFFEAIDSPVLTNITVSANGLPVESMYPKRPADLFAGGTLAFIGKYSAAAKGSLVVSARRGAREVRMEVPVDFAESEASNAALPFLWARYRIHELSKSLLTAQGEDQDRLVGKITDLAVRYRLASDYTAFVAVDESRIVGDGKPLLVLQPSVMPEGTASGSMESGKVDAWGVTMRTSAGTIVIDSVDDSGVAARSGLPAGAKMKSVNRVPIHDLRQLESVLLQSNTPTVEIELSDGRTLVLPTP